MQGLLLIAHGSLADDATSSVRTLTQAIQERTGLQVVEAAYLDYTPPQIAQGVSNCYDKGVRMLYVLPYFLTEGYLMKKAVGYAQAAAACYPDLQMSVGGAIGYDERMAQILLERCQGVNCRNLSV
ncbi:MAG: sirohydrochlorin chelatase [Bacilli bacterium]|nr:sirohydrochlorin chelatase [Bacilli bacterium]